MENKIYQVFISSTYSDLQEERRIVADAISKSGQIPAGMEYFPASSQEQFNYIKRIIDRSDYYVLLIAGRYGSISPSGLSFTHEEYNYAVAKGMPILAFLFNDIGKIRSEYIEEEKDKREKLHNFRNEIKLNRIVDFWEDAKELALKVTTSLTHEINLNPGLGWVRGNQAISAEIINTLESQRETIKNLKEQIESYNSGAFSFPKEIDDIESQLNIIVKIDENSDVKLLKSTWKDVFMRCGFTMQHNDSENSILKSITKFLIEESEIPADAQNPQSLTTLQYTLRYQFEALGLIQSELTHREIEIDDPEVFALGLRKKVRRIQNYTKWTLTDMGRRYLAINFAKKRPSGVLK